MTYSSDFRKKVLTIRKQESLSMDKVAKRFGVGLASVLRWSKNLEAKSTRNKPATKIDMEALKHDVEKHPDAYQYERAERLGVSGGCVFHALKRLGVTYKKNSAAPKGNSRKTLCFLRSDNET
jgi:transposase